MAESMGQSQFHWSVDHLFRRVAGQMVARLVGTFGIEHLDLAEEVVQDAFVSALNIWPYHGEPENPEGWLWTVARNRALDALRRHALWNERGEVLQRRFDQPESAQPVAFAGELDDDQLALIFACCHPALSSDAQVSLTLKVVCGFGVSEIGRAFLTKDATIAQRIVRAKQRLREQAVSMEIPEPVELPSRVDSVLEVLYLLFNEGYSAQSGDELLRQDLCREALRLTERLAAHSAVNRPDVDALAALFCFQMSRFVTRTDPGGDLVLLSQQDRSRWDRKLLQRGARHLRQSARGKVLTRFHLEAEIAGAHALAPSYEQTNWALIVEAYDALLERATSPVAALNRAVALAEWKGPQVGLDQLEILVQQHQVLHSFYPYWASHGRMLEQSGARDLAAVSYRRAAELTSNRAVRQFLQQRLGDLSGPLFDQ